MGGTADNRKRMFSIIDMKKEVQVSRLVYFSNFGNSLYLDTITVHYMKKKDGVFDVNAPNASDFE